MKAITIESLIVKPSPPHAVCYVGTREQLLTAGIATANMFPKPPARRSSSRYSTRVDDQVVGDFSVSLLKDGRWRVTRDELWNNPTERRRQEEAQRAERDRVFPGPQTADEYRVYLDNMVVRLGISMNEFVHGRGKMNGYRLASDDADEIMASIADLLHKVQGAQVLRAGVLDGLEAPLAECLRTVLPRPRPLG